MKSAVIASIGLMAFGFASSVVAQEACTPPGTQVITDPANDQTGAATGSNTQFDIRSASFAEPNWADGIARLTITLKVANLSSLPANGVWRVRFNYGSPSVKYFVSMNTPAESGAPTFKYGRVTTTTETLGDAEPQSGFNADGTITLVINKSKVGNPPPGATLQTVDVLAQQLVGAAGSGATATHDSTPATGPDHTLVAAGTCPIVDADGDGVIDGNDFCPDTPAGTEVKENGCPVVANDADGDGISDDDDECPNTPANTPVDGSGCPLGLPEHLLHFHGSPSHDAAGTGELSCTGNGAADLTACDGPFLHGSSELGTGPAAMWEANPVVNGNVERSEIDPNWIWELPGSTTIGGLTALQFWASCGGCGGPFSADWFVRVYADGLLKFESRVTATPATQNVASRLRLSLKLPDFTANDRVVLHIDPVYVDSQQNTRIYYDSELACPTSIDGAPCDSFVAFNAKDTDADGVPDAFDECQGTPPGTPVDAVGCPAAAECAADAAAETIASTPASGPITIDAAVRADWRKLGSRAPYGAFVQFFRQGTRSAQDAVLRAAGLEIKHDFRRYTTSVYVEGPVAAFEALSRHPWIRRIEHNRPLRYLDATQSWTMRARMAQERVGGGPYYDANGDVLTGKGITLGIIDSGMFGAHPDYGGLDRIAHNYKLVNPAGGPVYYQDVGVGDSENGGGGHGTHVSGIVAGGGQQSDGGYPIPAIAPFITGTFTSASPHSKIIHWGNGAVLFVLSVELAYQHLLDNIALPTFATLRAVNNSYGDGAGGQYNETDTDKQLIRQIVGCGVNMVFAAGNDGGDGTTDNTSSFCKDPTPGVICVASYNDEGTGRLDGQLSTFSSRGLAGDPENYPDIAAPGDLSTSTCAQATPTQAICTGGDDSEAETEWQPWYGTISGTSMASPNVVTAIGVLAQANPSLTAVEMEKLLQRTARKIGADYLDDPQHEGNTVHFGYGAGLVDVQAALEDMGIEKEGLLPVSEEWTIFDGDAEPDVAEPAANAVKLTMQNYNLDGDPGVMYRLTVEDGAGFTASPALNYRVENNVRGMHFRTTIVASPSGVTPATPSANNTAQATFVARDGNVVSFFVPYESFDYPPINEPIHNVRVVVEGPQGEIDYAPGPMNATVQAASVQPMFGRAFTIRLAPGERPPENSCVLPGVRTNNDSAFDSTTGNPSHEIQTVHFLEPYELNGQNTEGKLVVRLKIGDLSLPPPNTIWLVRFDAPTPPADALGYFIGFSTADGEQRFVHGTYTVEDGGVASVSTYQVVGDLEAPPPALQHSYIEPDGTMVLVADKALFGDLAVGDVLKNTLARVGPLSSNDAPIAGGAQDDTGAGFYVLRGSDICIPEPEVIAALQASTNAGKAPIDVVFTVGGTPSVGEKLARYALMFGDEEGASPPPYVGTFPEGQPVQVTHRYRKGGTFLARLTVTDSAGYSSTNLAQVTVALDGPDVVVPVIEPEKVPESDNRVGGGLGAFSLLLLGLAALRRARRAGSHA